MKAIFKGVAIATAVSILVACGGGGDAPQGKVISSLSFDLNSGAKKFFMPAEQQWYHGALSISTSGRAYQGVATLTVKDYAVSYYVTDESGNNVDLTRVSQLWLDLSFVDQTGYQNTGFERLTYLRADDGRVYKEGSYVGFNGSTLEDTESFIYPREAIFDAARNYQGSLDGVFGLPTNAKVGNSGVWFLTYKCEAGAFQYCFPTKIDPVDPYAAKQVKWMLEADAESSAILKIEFADGGIQKFKVDSSGRWQPISYKFVSSSGVAEIDYTR